MHRPSDQPRHRGRVLEVGEPGDLAGGEAVANDDRRLLGEHNLKATRLEALQVIRRSRRARHATP